MTTSTIGMRPIRRRWSRAAKARLVAAASAPGACVSGIAREHGVNRGQIYAWCREARERGTGDGPGALVPVVVMPDSAEAPAGRWAEPAPTPSEIEISFAGEVRVRLRGPVDGAALHAVVSALRQP